MKNLALLTFALSFYAAVGVTYILVSDFVDSENARIRDLCENQRLMPVFECYKRN